jgi:hypothetical protein
MYIYIYSVSSIVIVEEGRDWAALLGLDALRRLQDHGLQRVLLEDLLLCVGGSRQSRSLLVRRLRWCQGEGVLGRGEHEVVKLLGWTRMLLLRARCHLRRLSYVELLCRVLMWILIVSFVRSNRRCHLPIVLCTAAKEACESSTMHPPSNFCCELHVWIALRHVIICLRSIYYKWL